MAFIQHHTTITTHKTQWTNYIDLRFFLKFILLFSALYFFHQFYIGIITPGNYYSPFFADHLNYVSWIISLVLNTSNLMAHLLGLNSTVQGNFMSIPNGASIDMGWACAGLGIMSFWIAFVAAHNISKRKIFKWCLAGVCAILLLNCMRITLLLFSLQHHWRENIYVNHHDLFNYASYLTILVMVLYFLRTKQEQTIIEKNNNPV